MDSKPSTAKALELVPIEQPPAKSEPADEPRGLAETSTAAVVDKFVIEAARELEQGRLHEALWKRVLAAAGDDKNSAKTAYMRARAAELRAGRAKPLTKPAAPIRSETPRAASPARSEKSAPGGRLSGLVRKVPYRVGVGVGAVLLGFIVVLAATVAFRTDTPPPIAQASQPKPAAAAPAAAPQRVAAVDDTTQQLIARVQQLREAGNWNVHVLYATEWTRKEPVNAAAWHEVAAGYANLHQMREAAEAASKAAELSPRDAGLWRNLGEIEMARDDAEAALKAFAQASALDERDVYSRVQTGLLHLQLQQLPQARSAFDAVLAASPDNADALCGAIDVAHKQQRTKDAEALAKQLASAGGKCASPSEAAAPSATVAVKTPANTSRTATRRR